MHLKARNIKVARYVLKQEVWVAMADHVIVVTVENAENGAAAETAEVMAEDTKEREAAEAALAEREVAAVDTEKEVEVAVVVLEKEVVAVEDIEKEVVAVAEAQAEVDLAEAGIKVVLAKRSRFNLIHSKL